MKKLSLSQIAGMSCMIFAIFFGAGNMIFPPSMGQQAGTNAPIALLGFVLSDVGIAVAGVLAVVLAGTSMYELASRISPRFAKILSLTVYLCSHCQDVGVFPLKSASYLSLMASIQSLHHSYLPLLFSELHYFYHCEKERLWILSVRF